MGLQIQSCPLPGRAGLYPLLCGPPFPSSPAPFAFLDWPHPVSFITFSPPKLEEPQGLEFTPAPSPGRKIREIQGKRFPSLVLFIRPLLLPPKLHLEHSGPIVCPGRSAFSCICNSSSVGRGECAERGYECVGTVCVSKSVCRERRVCCGCGFVFPPKRLSGDFLE